MENTTDEEIEKYFAVNVFGAMKLARESIPAMRGGAGSIAAVASDAALQGNVQCSSTPTLRPRLLHPLPGPGTGSRRHPPTSYVPVDIDTPLLDKQLKDYGGSRKEMGDWYPLMRIGRPEEVGELIAFLLSPKPPSSPAPSSP